MAAKDYKAAKVGNIAPFPVNTIESYSLAAERLQNDIWNLAIDEIDANAAMPTDWVIGVLYRVIIEIQSLDYEE
tara:strand:+ start:1071 stop:1292 length:222 start_codon:yes stop_codon:yes gene_type:complete